MRNYFRRHLRRLAIALTMNLSGFSPHPPGISRNIGLLKHWEDAVDALYLGKRLDETII